MKVTIITVNYNSYPEIADCIDSTFLLNTDNFSLDRLVVDNGSTDGSVAKLDTQFGSKIRIIKLKKNYGFGTANNRGIKHCSESDYILLLNPDCLVVDPNLLLTLLRQSQQHPKAGIIGPAIRHQASGQTQYDYGGQFENKTGQARHQNYDNNNIKKISFPDFVTAACMLLTPQLLNTKIRFDERFFLYLEDVDLCLQARARGQKILHVPTAIVQHQGGSSSNDASKLFYSLRSSWLISQKWVKNKYKLYSLLYNLCFYTYLALLWGAKHLKNSLTPGVVTSRNLGTKEKNQQP